MNKQTSGSVSALAAGLINFSAQDMLDNVPREVREDIAHNIRSIAASCLTQDETPGEAAPKGDFHSRLKDEREDLDRRLTALNSFLTHNPGHPNPRHKAMLDEQSRLMAELLAVLDERICDLDISERSKQPEPVSGDDDPTGS